MSQNNRFEETYEKTTKIPNQNFLGEGVRKHHKKRKKSKFDPGPFLVSDTPTHNGGHRFCFGGPLAGALAFVFCFVVCCILVRFSARGVQKRHCFWVKNPMPKTFYKKTEGKRIVFLVSFFIAFLPVFLWGVQKHLLKNKGAKTNPGKKRPPTDFPFVLGAPCVGCARGRQKKIDGPPRSFAKSQTHPPTIRLFFIDFFLVRFWAFLGKGSSNTHRKLFPRKVHVENFFQKNGQKFRCQFSLDFFVLSCFRVFLSDGSSKTHKNRFAKKHRVEKVLQKIRPKIQNRLFLHLFYHVFGRFSVSGEGSSKTRQNSIKKINLIPSLLVRPNGVFAKESFFCGRFYFFNGHAMISSEKSRGAEDFFLKATYIWQMINQVGRYLFFLIV
jgi:hypothetical protein